MKRFFFVLFCLFLAAALTGGVYLHDFYQKTVASLPDTAWVNKYRPPEVTTVYARDHSIIGYLYQEKRFIVDLDVMPGHLLRAFMAAEDARFYEHAGIDVQSIARAFIANTREGTTSQGGSTITQQLVKRLLLTPEKSYERKIREAFLAVRLEKHLTKDEILALYLNTIYLGEGAYGVEAAARTYFARHVDQLTLAQAAVLAGLPQAPSRYNPYKNPAHTRERQLWVLHRMRLHGYISQQEFETAVAEPLDYASMPDPSWTAGAWYLEEVRRQLLAFFDPENLVALGVDDEVTGDVAVYQGGLHVYTAMDPVHQQAAEDALRTGLHAADHRQGWRGPIFRLAPQDFDGFLSNTGFSPWSLTNCGWARALVTSVTRQGAMVALSPEHTGFIAVQSMSWCRTPNPNVAADSAPRVQDATKVLAPGDVVWVSAVGAHGRANPVSAPAEPERDKNPVPPYNPEAVQPGVPIPLSLEQVPLLQGAVASIELGTGDLVAIAGGYNFSTDSQFNRATQARRQPGSSFKPIVYSAAIDYGVTPATIVYDTPYSKVDPYTGAVWSPSNADRKFLGAIRASRALASSRNVSTVRLAQYIGMDAVVARAHQLGITGAIPYVPAVSLGSHEATPQMMAEAYSAFANQGKRVKARTIIQINNCRHEPLVYFMPDVKQVITAENAYIMAHLLKTAVTAGTGRAAKVLDKPLAGKTGTTNDERDAWFIGFTPHLVTSVYIGHDDNSPMGRREYGAKAALPVFVDYRRVVEPFYPPDDFPVPQGILWTGGDMDEETGIGSGDPYIASVPRLPEAGYGRLYLDDDEDEEEDGLFEGEDWMTVQANFWD